MAAAVSKTIDLSQVVVVDTDSCPTALEAINLDNYVQNVITNAALSSIVISEQQVLAQIADCIQTPVLTGSRRLAVGSATVSIKVLVSELTSSEATEVKPR